MSDAGSNIPPHCRARPGGLGGRPICEAPSKEAAGCHYVLIYDHGYLCRHPKREEAVRRMKSAPPAAK